MVWAMASGKPGRLVSGGGRDAGQPRRLRGGGRQPRRGRVSAASLRGLGGEWHARAVRRPPRVYADGETTLAGDVLAALHPGMLCLADRQFFGYPLWQAACTSGAELLWRGKINLRLPRETGLADGSYLTTIYPSDKDRRHRTQGIRVRVIAYRLEGIAAAEPLYRLLTTILEPGQAPAATLAALYHERWEIESAFDELKTHLRGARIVLRSKTPDLVRQEFWGLLLAHFAIRGLMHEAALRAEEDPDRLSFQHAVRAVRRKLPAFATLSPSGQVCPA